MNNGKKGITVVGVEASSFHRLRCALVKMVPGEGLVRVTGKNGAGKTSLLRSIRAALGGAGEVLSDAVVNDASEDGTGQVRLELSNGFTVTRRFTEANPKGYLTVVGPDGGKHAQSKLAEWLGPLSFDPSAFFDLHPERQREILLSLGSDQELPAKLEALRRARRKQYEERTPWISQKRRTSQVAKPAGERPVPVDVSAELRTMGRLQKAERERADLIRETERAREAARTRAARERDAAAHDLEQAESWTGRRKQEAEDADNEVTRLRAELAEAERRASVAHERIWETVREEERVRASLEALPDPDTVAATVPDPVLPPDPAEEMEAVRARIEAADAVQQGLEPWKAWDRAQAELEEAIAAEKAITAQMEALEAQERGLIADAGIGVPGLTFGEDGAPLLNDRPLTVASGAERCRLAVAVAMAANADLRICLLDEEANGLDLDGLAELDRLAKEHGFQLWAARIGLESQGQIIVEDGVARSNPEAVAL